MRKFAKIKDHEGLVMDLSNGAILNTDNTVVLRHQKRINDIEKENRRENEINNIKSELSEIKQLIQMLIKKD